MNCPSCKVSLSRKEAKEGCPLCDWTPQRTARLKGREAARRERLNMMSRAQRNREIEASHKAHPRYGYLLRLTEYLIEQYRTV